MQFVREGARDKFSPEWTVAAVVLAVAPLIGWSGSWSAVPLLILPPVNSLVASISRLSRLVAGVLLASHVPVRVALVGLVLAIPIVRVAVLCGCMRCVDVSVVTIVCGQLLLLPHLIIHGSYRCWLLYHRARF